MTSPPDASQSQVHQSPDSRDQPLSQAARPQPGGLAPLGRRQRLERARKEDKPILLSIGYSACHWCHVMERESFENEDIARIMNQYFVNVKVDREERPDLDSIYMSYVQMTTGSGGWPMTVFLTPDQVPFFGGTYFPPDDRYGRPGFPKICFAVHDAYQKRRAEIEQSAADIVKSLQRVNQTAGGSGLAGRETLSLAFRNLAQRFDLTHGGFGGAPKFPGSMNLAFCLRHYHRTGFQPALDFAELSLEKMALGRHLRSAGRRISSLLRRRPLAGAAF